MNQRIFIYRGRI